MLSEKVKSEILKMQKNEITEYYIYNNMSLKMKDEHNRDILKRISNEERAHYDLWKTYTKEDVAPDKRKIHLYTMLCKIFGFTFVLKLMESGENKAGNIYSIISKEIPEAKHIAEDEDRHEHELLDMLDEEKLQYVGSMVLGLNDALVELTGTLAGLTFALQNTRLIALSGLITGISATLSMASSEFLSARAEGRTDALKSCTYTGIAYLITVAMLVIPYLIFPENGYVYALAMMIFDVVLIIFVFNYYISVAKGYNFRKRFTEMAGISLGVAALSFVVGLLVKQFLGIDV